MTSGPFRARLAGRHAAFVGLSCLLVLTGIGASCSGNGREGTLPELAEARLPRPALRLVAITDLMGYLEPCGCTSRPLGGLDRLAAALRRAKSDGVPTLFVASGDLFFDESSHGVDLAEATTQEVWKAETVAEVLSSLDLAAATVGSLDLRFGLSTFQALRTRARFPLLAAGVRVLSSIPANGTEDSIRPAEPDPLPARHLLEVGSVRVALIGISDVEGEGIQREGNLVELARHQARAARDEGAELVIVLARASRRTVRQMATDIPDIDFIVQGGVDQGSPSPPNSDGAPVLHASHHGQGLLVVDIVPGEGARWIDASTWTRAVERDRLRAEAEALRARIAEWERDPNIASSDLAEQRARLGDIEAQMRRIARAPDVRGKAFAARFLELGPEAPRDPEVRSVLGAYFRRVNEHNREVFAAFLPKPAPEGTPHYVGVETCGRCHAEALAWWRTTLHARAYRTLQDLHKEYNLSCVGCHVTGYNEPGGSTVAHVGPLQDVGCESCHGPGSQHVTDPTGAAVNVRRDVPEAVCVRCHNPEHSDRFHYPTYRRMMIAPGHGLPPVGAGTRDARGSR
jgi:hypothetical protein